MDAKIDSEREKLLILRCKNGDKAAYEELVKAYRVKLYWSVFQLLRNEEDARDISQEAFVKVYKALDRFDSRRAFYPWLYRVARNLALDYIKKHGAHRKVSLEYLIEDNHQHFDTNDCLHQKQESVREKIQREQLSSKLAKGLEKLKPEFREVILMKHLQEMNYHDISLALNIPEGTVMSRLFHARKALAAELEDLKHEFVQTKSRSEKVEAS
ncbi:MAG: RNA polymerase sigma factor [Sumerlaeia bacterium]